jgi:hypothetical protein
MGSRAELGFGCILLLALTGACSSAPSDAPVDEIAQATTCGVTLTRYPIMAPHNTGYDPTAGDSSQWSCDDAHSNTDFGGAHIGIDIWAAEGAPVVATVDGTLLLTGWSDYSGNKVTIQDGCGWYHFYCHLKDIAPGIGDGVYVTAGTVLGSVGKTGTASNGVVHLHYSVYPDGNYDAGVDPWPYLHEVEQNVCQNGPAKMPSAQGGVVAWAPNRLDAFARGTDDTLTHAYWDGTGWGPIESLGGVLTSEPAVAAWGENRLDVFTRGEGNGLAHIAWDGSAWSAWEALGGELTSNPTVVSWGPNRLDVFARGKDQDLLHTYFDGNGWGAWESLGGVLTSSPVAVSWGPNRLDIFARGTGDGLAHKAWDGTAWSEWTALGGTLTSAPTAVSWEPNRLDVFARGADNDLVHIYFSNGWGAWESLGGTLTSDPAVTAWGPNRLDIFARGASAELSHMWWDGTAWSAWESLGGELESDPTVISWGSERIDIFSRAPDATLQHKAFQSGWFDPDALGGSIACSGDPAAVIDFCPLSGGAGGTGGTGGWSGGAGSGGSGANPSDPSARGTDEDSGCSCTLARGGSSPHWLAFGLAAIAFARRRRGMP